VTGDGSSELAELLVYVWVEIGLSVAEILKIVVDNRALARPRVACRFDVDTGDGESSFMKVGKETLTVSDDGWISEGAGTISNMEVGEGNPSVEVSGWTVIVTVVDSTVTPILVERDAVHVDESLEWVEVVSTKVLPVVLSSDSRVVEIFWKRCRR
jgi:hypothetical protein